MKDECIYHSPFCCWAQCSAHSTELYILLKRKDDRYPRVDRNLTCGKEQRTKWVQVGGRRLIGGRRKGDGMSGWGLGQPGAGWPWALSPSWRVPALLRCSQLAMELGLRRDGGALVWEQLSQGCTALYVAWLPFGRAHQPRGKVMSQDMALGSGSPGQPPCPGDLLSNSFWTWKGKWESISGNPALIKSGLSVP